MKEYKKLTFWQEAHNLAIELYNHTRRFPKEELYGITSQLRRAALSVPTNITEGCGRESRKEFRRYLVIASGSIVEVEYLLLVCLELNLLSNENYSSFNDKAILIKKKLTAYKNKL